MKKISKNNKTHVNDIEKNIIEIIKNESRPISKREIAGKLNLSPATTGKYVDVLVAKKSLKIEKYGNIHLISMNN